MARNSRRGEDPELVEEELDVDDLPNEEMDAVVLHDRASGIGLFAGGIVLGALIGAGIAIFMAPARGAVTRRRVRRRFRNIQDGARSHLDDWREEARDGLDRQRRRLGRRARPRA